MVSVNPGAEIYYTIDNTYPPITGSRYTEPFEIPEGKLRLRIQVYKEKTIGKRIDSAPDGTGRKGRYESSAQSLLGTGIVHLTPVANNISNQFARRTEILIGPVCIR